MSEGLCYFYRDVARDLYVGGSEFQNKYKCNIVQDQYVNAVQSILKKINDYDHNKPITKNVIMDPDSSVVQAIMYLWTIEPSI